MLIFFKRVIDEHPALTDQENLRDLNNIANDEEGHITPNPEIEIMNLHRH